MRLSYFTPLRSAWNFQLPFPPQGETFLQGGRGVRPIASRRLLCAILSTNQMQNQKQSRLGHPRFPAFRLIGRFALSSHWLFRVFPFLLIVITLVSVLITQSKSALVVKDDLFIFECCRMFDRSFHWNGRWKIFNSQERLCTSQEASDKSAFVGQSCSQLYQFNCILFVMGKQKKIKIKKLCHWLDPYISFIVSTIFLRLHNYSYFVGTKMQQSRKTCSRIFAVCFFPIFPFIFTITGVNWGNGSGKGGAPSTHVTPLLYGKRKP